MPPVLALDASVRSYDKDGRLHIARSRISKACVNPYLGREIPGWEALGLDPDKIYKLLRHPDELAKAAPTFERNQILSKHIPVNSADIQRDVIAGSIGSNVEFVEPYLWADLCIWDDAAIAGIETNKVRELSPAYHYTPVMTAGVYQGEDFDGIMTDIHGNHLCLVEVGRTGSDVLAADSKLELFDMKKTTKKGAALIVTLGALSPKLAQDAALLPALVGKFTKKSFNRDEVTAKLIAVDSELDVTKLGIVFDGAMEDEPKPAQDEDDETEEEKKKRLAEDEEEEAEKKKVAQDSAKAITLAVDSAVAVVTANLKAADEARRAVRSVVGDVAMDSASDIYGFALDHLKIGHAGVTDPVALKAIFDAGSKVSATPSEPRLAQDSATAAATMFPGMDRFKQR